MDEELKVATRVCDLLAPTGDGNEGNPPFPMYLIVVRGGIPGAMLRLTDGGTRVGRAPDNTYQLRERCVSRYHASFRTDPTGGVWLTDLSSTNGTFLNGCRIPALVPSRVKDGDRIQFGSAAVVKFVRLDPSDEQFQRDMFERSVRDALTGLYNRDFFLNQVGPLAERNTERLRGLAVLLLDIDHFKRVNDTHGHDAGDLVLREVAEVLRDATRPEDLVARYGGEEFVIALPVAAPDQASERAEKIRQALADRRIDAGGAAVRVTASLGLSFAPPGRVGPIGVLISQADQCLYRAKREGRNRTVIYSPPRVGGRESTADGSVPSVPVPV